QGVALDAAARFLYLAAVDVVGAPRVLGQKPPGFLTQPVYAHGEAVRELGGRRKIGGERPNRPVRLPLVFDGFHRGDVALRAEPPVLATAVDREGQWRAQLRIAQPAEDVVVV